MRQLDKQLRALATAIAEQMPETPSEVLNKSGVCSMLAISLSTLNMLMRDQGFPRHLVGMREYRFLRSEILDWLKQQPSKPEFR